MGSKNPWLALCGVVVSIALVPFVLVSCILGVLIDYAIRGIKSMLYTGGEK